MHVFTNLSINKLITTASEELDLLASDDFALVPGVQLADSDVDTLTYLADLLTADDLHTAHQLYNESHLYALRDYIRNSAPHAHYVFTADDPRISRP